MNERLYQPSLLWAKFKQYAQSIKEKPGRNLELFIYRTDTTGAYYMNDSGKLYWDVQVGDGYFSNCDQDELFENRDHLGEVTALGISRERGPVLLAKTFTDFLKLIDNGEKSMLNDIERIAEKAEFLVQEAKQSEVNIFILVQKNPQGAAFYAGEKKQLASLVESTLDDLRKNEFEENGVGIISFGL